jgi:uncharacterized membrane protein YfhO
MNLPFTGVGKASLRDVQSIIDRSPKGIPFPLLQPINKIDTLLSDEKALVGDWSFYNKQIGTVNEAPYPIRLKAIANKFEKIENRETDSLMTKPFLFILPESERQSIVLKDFTPNQFRFEANTAKAGLVILQQSFYPHWVCSVNNSEKRIEKYNDAFMSVPVNSGKSIVEYRFDPSWIKTMMIFSLLVFILSLIYLALPKFKSTSLS